MDVLVLLLIGFASGLLGGLLGIGGSMIMIPVMTRVFGPAQHLYQGAAMIMNFFVAAPAASQHFRAKAVLLPIVRVTIPASVVAVLLGVWLSDGWWFRGDNEVYLSAVFGLFLLYAAGYNVYRFFSVYRLPDVTDSDALAIPKWKAAIGVGVPMGLIGGLLGVGGGILAVPLQQLVLRIPLRRAIANSAVTIVPLSMIGAVYKNVANAHAGIAFTGSLHIAICLVPTAMLGALVGSRLTHKAPRKALRLAVILLLAYGGFRMVFGRSKKAKPAFLNHSQVSSREELVARSCG